MKQKPISGERIVRQLMCCWECFREMEHRLGPLSEEEQEALSGLEGHLLLLGDMIVLNGPKEPF